MAGSNFRFRSQRKRYQRGRRIRRQNGGGTRSQHFHPYPNGPYGSGENRAIPPLGWDANNDGQLTPREQFHPDVQGHWGQYPGGYSYGADMYMPNPTRPHTGYYHSSTNHSHQPKHLRRSRSIGVGGLREKSNFRFRSKGHSLRNVYGTMHEDPFWCGCWPCPSCQTEQGPIT